MLSKEVVELSKQHSIIRDIFEYGMKRAKEVGAENVFDFSIGNPSVPAPKEIDETALRLLKTADPVDIHGYTSNAGVLEVRENIAKSLNKRFDTNYTAANIFMTIGAAAALGICFKTLVDGPEDEVITVTMEDGKKYRVHTVNELLPGMDITGTGVKASDAGVYTFALDHFFLRVNTDGELVYYRYIPQYEVTVDDRSGDAENMAENFAAQDAVDGSRYYTAFIELEPTFRNAMGGFSSGYYLVMDDNYVDIDQATLKANSDEKHYHGQGYLDQHEFVVLGKIITSTSAIHRYWQTTFRRL